MKRITLVLMIVSGFVANSFGWGQTGHRVIGQIAAWHLSKKASKNIEAILGPESLAMVSTWMDEVRSDPAYNHLNTWHYLTVKAGQGYDPDIQESGGDAYGKTKMVIAALKEGNLSERQKSEYLRILVHLVGDLHQPLHVGTGEDRGGNDIRLSYFNESTNLHAVWDTRVIEGRNLSFTELAHHLNRRVNKPLIRKYQASTMDQWLDEAVELRPLIYDLPEDRKLSYAYGYRTFPVMEERLLAGGIRLAGILNDIFG
ncbi:S1/P1 Nuclease [Cyclobacterium lianum]|uniref:S1/P1 Nuclease n=1 Tax=Cyclobacterium lianum TaxID=388280 RepID=A0A1M7HSW2_9BACT|nr:S1/P1 nuclease [Cyclobacterium lianum]SHM31433.1 S1/P1 Nuclease [Cyclobacterium lianum]